MHSDVDIQIYKLTNNNNKINCILKKNYVFFFQLGVKKKSKLIMFMKRGMKYE